MGNQQNNPDTANQTAPKRTEVSFFATRIERHSLITSAMITATVDDPTDIEEESFKTKLRNALSDWVQTTTAGQEAWNQSSEDFNFGDLSMVTNDTELVFRLAAVGIHELRVVVVGHQPHSWNFDEVLIDDEQSLAFSQ